jgi:hypothetical protein
MPNARWILATPTWTRVSRLTRAGTSVERRRERACVGDWQGRQAVVAVLPPHKPDERSVWRRHDGVGPNAAVSAVEFQIA